MTDGAPRRRRALLLGAALLALASAHAQPQAQEEAAALEPRSSSPWRRADARRVVVVPDVHGAYEALVGLLRAAGIVDASLAWSGGDAVLVSLGDLLDRGSASRRVMDLLMRLEREAAAAGGGVHVLLGNHEAMNLLGDLRYVSAAEYAAFAAEEPPGVRAAAYERFVATLPAGTADADARAAFERLYPPGFFGHRRAFAPDGTYGAWLLSRPAVVVIGDTAFVHGGLSGAAAAEGLDAINRSIGERLRRYLAVRAELAAAGVLPAEDPRRDLEIVAARREGAAAPAPADEADDAGRNVRALLDELLAASRAPELDVSGPLWYRGSVYCNPLLERPVLDAALERLDAERVVVGHTPTGDRRARALHDGRLVMLDTGMLADYYHGRPAALVLEAGRAAVQYLEPEELLPLERGRIEAFGLTEEEIEAVLANGVVEARDGAEDRVIVRHAGDAVPARVYTRRAADLELAAHALDRLLGLNLVPTTVARELDGRAVALQLEYEDAITEAEVAVRGAAFETWCPIEPQAALMYAFDALLQNAGRTRDNVLLRRDGPLLKLVAHGRAFGTERRARLPEGREPPPELLRALSALDEARVREALRERLDRGQIEALLVRRQALLDAFAGR
ncbi:MAG TPA: metallophosphoesterase [Gammaproteobacteria bacterium]